MEYLKGSGHFAIGFWFGYIIFFFLVKRLNKSFFWVSWGPFLPFIFGVIACIPYAFELADVLGEDMILNWKFNFFFFYSTLHDNKIAISIFNKFFVSSLSVVLLYCTLIVYYIKMIRKYRRHA